MDEEPRPTFKWLWISVATVLLLAVVIFLCFVFLAGSTPLN
jgi:hypothetical protein